MSAARIITDMGAAVALVDGKVKLSGLDRLPAEVAERVLDVARKHREELARELSGASAPGPETGLDWLPGPPADDGPDFAGWWGAFDLADLAKLYSLRVVAAGGRVLVLYPPSLSPDLVSYAEALLNDAKPCLVAHLDKLPVLAPADAVENIKGVMRRYKGLRFTRGEGGSMWPLYPTTWSMRNVDRKQGSFSLPVSNGYNFYPDFVAKLKDGRILIVEYKGKPFLNDDTREKENIGQLWEEKSQGQGLFLLATWMDAEGRHTQRQTDEKIRHGK